MPGENPLIERPLRSSPLITLLRDHAVDQPAILVAHADDRDREPRAAGLRQHVAEDERLRDVEPPDALVKASNVVAEGGRAKLIDLSLARPPGRYHAGIGTWCNLSPEQARGGELGAPADVWGLGTVLYEAASGAPAYDDDSWTGDSGTLDTDDQREAGYPQLRGPGPSARGRAPAALAAAIDACLAPAPADRPTLDELMKRLQPLAA